MQDLLLSSKVFVIELLRLEHGDGATRAPAHSDEPLKGFHRQVLQVKRVQGRQNSSDHLPSGALESTSHEPPRPPRNAQRFHSGKRAEEFQPLDDHAVSPKW